MNNDCKFTLAHYRDVKSHNWNRTCPQCGKREFSPYIDLYTGRPIDDKHCGKCNRETNCGYHQPPREWFAEHRTERHEWLPREQYIAKKRQERLKQEQQQKSGGLGGFSSGMGSMRGAVSSVGGSGGGMHR